MSLIFLIGMPGAGKSYWGRQWSKSSGFAFADLDEQVEAYAEVTIPFLFQRIGEKGFRGLEATVLLDTIAGLREKDAIIATGGGTPVFNSNMDIMLRSGCVVYLRADTGTLLRHLTRSESVRPLLRQEPDAAFLEGILEQRKTFYERAHLSLSVEQASLDTFAQIRTSCTGRLS